MPTERSSSTALSRASRLDTFAMRPDHLDDLIADAVDRVQRRHRILEDHRDALAADVAQLVVVELGQIAAVELDRAGDRRVGRAGQPEDGLRGDALAGAGFADDGQDFALVERERDARRPRAPRRRRWRS